MFIKLSKKFEMLFSIFFISTLALLLAIPKVYAAETLVMYNGIKNSFNYKVTFKSDTNGNLNGQTTIYLEEGSFIGEKIVPTPVPNKGYIFDKWINLEGQTIDYWSNEIILSDMTYIAKFKKINLTDKSDKTYPKLNVTANYIYCGLGVICLLYIYIYNKFNSYSILNEIMSTYSLKTKKKL